MANELETEYNTNASQFKGELDADALKGDTKKPESARPVITIVKRKRKLLNSPTPELLKASPDDKPTMNLS